MAGCDSLADRCLLADEATQLLRGDYASPSHSTLWRFYAGADLGPDTDRQGGEPAMPRLAWALGPRPALGL